MNRQRRNQYDIKLEILRITRTGVNKTSIVYGANLNFKIVKGYLNDLINKGLLIKNNENKYINTDEGNIAINQLQYLVNRI